jgi:hypothetical protein
MELVPKVLKATLIRENGNPTEKQVKICHVNYDKREKLGEKGEVEFFSGKFMVMIRRERRYAVAVQPLKEGATLQGPARRLITGQARVTRRGRSSTWH